MEDKVTILWVNDNPETAHTMVFMYATNAKTHSWFKDVEVIIWGPTAKLTAENKEIQDKIKMAQHVGVKISACITCASMYEVVDDLKALDIDVFPMGIPLTEKLKNKEYLLTI